MCHIQESISIIVQSYFRQLYKTISDKNLYRFKQYYFHHSIAVEFTPQSTLNFNTHNQIDNAYSLI